MGLSYLARQIQKLAGFDLQQVAPVSVVDRCQQPALFLHGLEDSFVGPHHSRELHDRYSGPKKLVLFHGTHSAARTAVVMNAMSEFLYHVCLSRKHQAYMGPVSMPLMVTVKTLGSNYFLVKHSVSCGNAQVRVKPHVVLFVDTTCLQLKLPWMEVRACVCVCVGALFLACVLVMCLRACVLVCLCACACVRVLVPVSLLAVTLCICRLFLMYELRAPASVLVCLLCARVCLLADSRNIILTCISQLTTAVFPYSRVFSYSVKEGSFSLEVLTDSAVVAIYKFYTPEVCALLL